MSKNTVQFTDLSHLPYADQAKWFLNGFWKQEAQAGDHFLALEDGI